MSWRAIAESDITSKISADELASIRASAPDGTNPVADSVTHVTNMVRGYVASNSRNVMGPEGTIPERLMGAACALLVPDLYGRTAGMLIDLNDVRVKAAEAATTLLRDVALGRFAVELPVGQTAANEDAKSASAQLITKSASPLRRDDLAGL
jgi:hypothetical protein